MIELSEIRRRVRQTIDRARKESAARRAESDAAAERYREFLRSTAEPIVRQVAVVLKAEGHPFELQTPAGALRLAADRGGSRFIEIALDTTGSPPVVVGRSAYDRGRDHFSVERPLKAGAAIADLTESDVLEFLLEALTPLLER